MNHRKRLWRALGLWWLAAVLLLSVFFWLESHEQPLLLMQSEAVSGGDEFAGAPALGLLQKTRDFVQELPPVDVTVFANPRSKVGRLIKAFLQPYTQANSHGQVALRARFIDPASNPALVRINNIGLNGEMLLNLRKDIQSGASSDLVGNALHVQALDTEVFLNTWSRLARISRGDDLPWMVIAQGSGSRPIAIGVADGSVQASASSIGRWVRRLQKSGYRVLSLPLSELASVRENAQVKLLVFPAPQQPVPTELLAGPEAPAILWLTEPELAEQQAPFELALGLMSLAPSQQNPSASTTPSKSRVLALSDFVDNELGRNMPAPVVMPGALAFVPLDDSGGSNSSSVKMGWQAVLNNSQGHAVTWYRPGAVVVGDTDFISDDYLTRGGNPVFARRLLDYLLEQPHFIPPAKPSASGLLFTESSLLFFSVLVLFVIPLLFAVVALWQWRAYRRLR